MSFNVSQKDQHLKISVNGQPAQSYTLTKDEKNSIAIELSSNIVRAGYISLALEMPSARRPRDIAMGDDDRLLSVGLISATFY